MPLTALHHRRPLGERLTFALALLLPALATAPCPAVSTCVDKARIHVRPQDEIVLISSRPIGCRTDPQSLTTGLHAESYDAVDQCGGRAWRPADWQSIADWHDPSTPTVVYVHGNRIHWNETKLRGLFAYTEMLRCAPDTRPIRLLIWSWKADQVRGPIRDYRLKANRTGPVAKQLAWVVNQMPSDQPVGFLAYSFGARVTNGALHLLGGGRIGRLRLEDPAPHPQVRAFYIAAALDASWLSRRGAHCRAMDAVEKLMVVINRSDPAMRYFRFLPRNSRPQAMGYQGPTCLARGDAQRVRLIPATNSVGRSHHLCDYVHARGLMACARKLLTFEDSVTLADGARGDGADDLASTPTATDGAESS